MKNLSVREILEQTNGELIIGNKNLECKTFSNDTRKLQKGDTYIGIKGETFNGNNFWKQAFEKGADCVIVEGIEFSESEKKEFSGKTIIKVENTLEALYSIAKYKRSLYNIPVVAITGSVGKTSTKDLVANVVSQKYKTLKTIGNHNNNIGLPLTILRLQDEEAMVLEMGMNHLGEISLLSSIAKPNICVITNIGTSHIGILGSRENILKAKLEILEGAENPEIIINKDNDMLCKWHEQNQEKEKIITYGIESKSDYMAKNIKPTQNSSTYTCEIQDKEQQINVPVGGNHFVLNSLCAIAVGKLLKIEPDKIKKGIESFKLTKNRMDITELPNGVKIINDAYNASFESMQASLQVLAGFFNNRKIAILGDMFELGNFSEELHRKVGKEVFKRKIDILVCSGKYAKEIAKEAKKEGMPKENIYYFEKKEEIVPFLKNFTKKGDILFFKASNGMKFYQIAEEFCKFGKE